MARVYIVLWLVTLVLCIYCLVRVISTPDDEIRHLPKWAWIVLILLFPLVGSIVWLAVGQPRTARPARYERSMPTFPEYDRPGRAAGVTPESDEEFLRRVRGRAEEQRRAYEEKKRREAEEA